MIFKDMNTAVSFVALHISSKLICICDFQRLQQLLAPHLHSRQVAVEKKLLASLWLLGNKESFRGVADLFDFNKGFFTEYCLRSAVISRKKNAVNFMPSILPNETLFLILANSERVYSALGKFLVKKMS